MLKTFLVVVIGVAGCSASDDFSEPRWHTVFDPGDIEINSGALGGVWAGGGGNVWLAGDDLVLGRGGDEWLELETGDGTQYESIHFLNTGSLVAVGAGGVMSRFYNGVDEQAAPRDVTLRGVWGVSESDLWIAGGDTDAALFTLDDTETIVDVTPAGASGPLHDVAGDVLDPTDRVAVGDDGVILEYDGTAWQLADSPTVASLRGVAIEAGTAIAVGQTPAVVLERIDDAWVDITPPGLGGSPEAVSISPTGTVCVVGGGGVRFRRVAGEWLDESDGAPGDLIDVASADDDVYAISSQGGLVQYGLVPLSSEFAD